ncbi:MAG: DUF4919 domain-containing protein [Ignavibacteriales bacterium]|nr:DUF4919 domain-containing protein [Ignavibacteriales bacterium]
MEIRTKVFFINLIILFTIIFQINLLAENKENSTSYFTTDTTSNYFLFSYVESLTADDYYILLDSIKLGLSDDFFTLRMAYTHTEKYSPYSTRLSNDRDLIQNLINENKLSEALEQANQTLDYSYVDAYIHYLCHVIYEQMGNKEKADFHFSLVEKVFESIIFSGDGQTPQTAIIVISVNEEYALLSWFGLKMQSQSLIIQDGYNFDLLTVRDDEANEEYEMYFNVTIPMNSIMK